MLPNLMTTYKKIELVIALHSDLNFMYLNIIDEQNAKFSMTFFHILSFFMTFSWSNQVP